MNPSPPKVHPREVRRALTWFAGILWRGSPKAMLLNTSAQFLTALLPAGRILLIKELVDAVHAGFGQGEDQLIAVAPLLAGLAGLQMLEAGLEAVQGHSAAAMREQTSWKLQERVLDQAAGVGLDAFERREFFDRMQRARQAAYYRAYGIFRDATAALEGFVMLCTLIALFATGHWSIPVVLFLGTAPVFYTQIRRGREIYALFHQQTPKQRRAEYLVELMTDRDAAKEIRLYGLGDLLVRTYEQVAQTLRQQRLRLTLQQQRYMFGGRLSGIISALLSLVILLYQATYGALTLGGFFALAEAITRFQGTLFQLLRQMGNVFEQALHIRDLRDFVESPTEPEGQVALPAAPLEIAVEDAGFAYGDGPPVLSGVNLRIRPGEKLALVGENGAGKTTLIKLILGLYQPSAGRVLYNGVDGREINPQVLRQRCAAVFQDFVQYQRTARENIGYGQAEALANQARVERAATAGGSALLIESLAERYDTTLGRYFEGGQDLSRGQWQKLALSRAYFDRISVRLQRQVVDKVQKVELVHFEHPAFYDALKRANEDLSGRLLSLLNVALDTVGALGGMVAVVGVLLTGHWALGPLTLIGSVPGVWVMMRISKKTHYVYRERTPQYREASYFRELLTEREQAMEVRLFTLRDHLLDTWREKAVALATERRGLEAKRAWLGGLSSSIGGWGYVGCLTILVWLVAGAQLTIGQYGMLARAVLQFAWQLGGIMRSLNTLHEESLYLGDLYEFFALTAPTASLGAEDEGQDLKNRPLRFEQVSFRYPDGDLVLSGIDLEIRPGERIALVGENGAGKTTLVKLMLGLYQPTGGRILLGNKPLLDYPQERVRRLFAAVFQDFVRFQFPVRDNIAFGALGQDASVERAAELAGAAQFIAGLPGQYEALLGKELGGTDLSTGEWQKLATARALARAAEFVVLDEPTAALDPKAEAEVYRRFGEMTRGKASVMISHRLGAARAADRILVLKGGQIVEQGTHAALMQQGGEYSRLFSLQARWYE